MAAILLIIHIRNKTHERSAEVLNEGVKSKLISKVFLLFDITVKEGRNLRDEVEKGLNWMKFIRSDLNEKKLGQCTYYNKFSVNCFYALFWHRTFPCYYRITKNSFFGHQVMHGKTMWKTGIDEIAKVFMGLCPCTPQGGFTSPH